MPNEKLRTDYNDPEAIPGVISKVASVSPLEVTDADLKTINKYTLSPVSAEDVFIFKATIADNEQDDRNSMPFNLKALQDLKKLYPGKTMLKDHARRADNQIARIYDTELVQDASKQTELGELHTELIAKIYMIKTDSNKDLIAEIMGGIKKEVSTSTVPEKMICNICGVDNMKDYCRHWPGREYDVSDATGKSSKKRCKMLLHGAKDAHELSFVAVPAQPRAGTHKSIGFTKPVAETPETTPETETKNIDNEKTDARLVSLRLKNAESFFNAENESEEKITMNKKMREILAKIQEKTVQAKAFMDGENKDIDKANALMDEVDALQKEYEAEKRVYEIEKMTGAQGATTPVEPKGQEKETPEVDAVAKFGQDAKAGFKLDKSMNEGTNADGGYTVPEDIVTRIETYRDAKASLLHLVTVVPVSTNKGQRTFKKRAQQTGFTKVGEGGKIGAKNTPQFERISYEIEKYAGYFPVTNEVLDDSDANLGNVLIEWIGDESRVTANKLILEQIATKEQIDLVNMDGVKKAVNVTLGQAFKATAKIVTNDDGLQYLDTLKDQTGRYLLAPMPGDTMVMTLQVGAQRIPVEVIPNADMPSQGTKVPMIIGDLKEGIVYWDRKQMNIKISDVAVVGELNAYEEDLTLYRAIEREDVTPRDLDAFVNGYIDTAVVGE